MKKILHIICTLTALTGTAGFSQLQAQSPKQHLRIQISYEGTEKYLEQAVETIEAVNTVNEATTVDYRAGQSISLLPGFEARNGSIFTAAIKPVTNSSKSEFPLQLTALPNPFDQSTTIEYYLPADGKVNMWITDAQGKVVGRLVQDEIQTAGKHQIEWKPQSIPSGVYVPVIDANQQRVASRIIKK